MARKKTCSVEGCSLSVHAKGYCRKHYGQVWRKGRINHEHDAERGHHEDAVIETCEDTDRMRALERELRKAQNMYRQVVGFEGRLKWRKEMEAVRKEINRLRAPAEEEAVAT